MNNVFADNHTILQEQPSSSGGEILLSVSISLQSLLLLPQVGEII
jgi:hypothetical protein